jgi:uncharacterized spore protein YtfJ
MEVHELLSMVAENLSVRRAFGTAYEKDGILIIPVALVIGGGGGGEGRAPRSRRGYHRPEPLPAEGEANGNSPEGALGMGSGGGFGGVVFPVGTYVVKGEDVRWVPAVNVTLIAMAGIRLVRAIVRLSGRGRLRKLA